MDSSSSMRYKNTKHTYNTHRTAEWVRRPMLRSYQNCRADSQMLLLSTPVLSCEHRVQHVSRLYDNDFRARLSSNVATNRQCEMWGVENKGKERYSDICVRYETRRPCRCRMSSGASNWCMPANSHARCSARNTLPHE